LIIRDHNKIKFEKRKEKVAKIVRKINKKFAKQFGEDIAIAEINDQYYNMKEKVVPVKYIVDIAEKANEVNIKPLIKTIRGGTDGCQLSYKGLPCPNIFADIIFMVNTNTFLLKACKKAVDVIVK
jgi:tripeptide aminopeptidase